MRKLLNSIQFWIYSIWFKALFGTIEIHAIARLEGIVCEMYAYSGGTDGAVIGHWAYGHWDPTMPYTGQHINWIEG